MINWGEVRWFKKYEFDSPDDPGSGNEMSGTLIGKLERLRSNCGFPIHINSGFRTPEHNSEIGGKDSSAHLRGRAVDISCRSSAQRYQLIKEALGLGFKRIGIGDTFIHLDVDESLPQNVIWTY